MDELITQLAKRADFSFKAARTFCWSPEARQVQYDASATDLPGTWSLLHETSHGLLKHTTYATDFDLLRLEMDAWERAKCLAQELGLPAIDEGHIQDCLDTYRDWLHRRSSCPSCSTKSLQTSKQQYACFNCGSRWRVTPSRFCRAYRATIPT